MYPKLVHIYGPLSVQSYGFMIAIAFLIFVYFFYNHPLRSKIISSDLFFSVMFIGLGAGIIGGRIFFALTYWSVFSSNWVEFFYPWIPGFSLLGSMFAILIAVPIFLKKHKIKILPFLDLACIYAPLLQSISRIGCLLAGCCYGKVATASLKWSIIFKNSESLAPLNICLHPTQIYSSLASFLIFIFMYFRAKYFKFSNGEICFTYLLLECIARFFVDFWRGEREIITNFFVFADFFTNFSYSQLAAFILFIFSFIGLIFIKVKNK